MSTYNAETIPDLLAPGGVLAENVPAFEDRPYQRELALEVARLLEEGGRLAVEAPTGIGKSLAYGVPAAAWSLAGNGPVVVATHTRTLQDQLLKLEAPRLARAVGRPLRVELLKGRTNYLCKRRFEAMAAEATGSGTQELFARIRPWIERTATGDLGELDALRPGERIFLEARVASDMRFCAHSRCTPETGCFFKRARARAGEANLLIVNHALLAIHLFGERDLLATFDALVIDEAHAFVRVALDHLSEHVGPSRLTALAEDLPGRKPANLLLRDGEGASRLAAVHRAFSRLETEARAYFGSRNGERPVEDPRQRYRDEAELTALSPLSPEGLRDALGTLSADADALRWYMESRPDEDEDHWQAARAGLERFRGHVLGFREGLERLLRPEIGERDRVTWKEWGEGSGFSLCSTPIELGPRLAGQLRDGPAAVVFTSATLAAGKDFGYFSRDVGLGDSLPSIAYPSPFDFSEQAIFLAVRRGPDPRQAGWTETTATTLAQLLEDPGRKTLALFTSYRDLTRVAERLRGTETGFQLLVQEPGGEPSVLLDRFRKAKHALLLGTATFWEGVDLPGDDLEVLVLTRLPFGVPTDPRFAARAERLEAEGGNAFTDLYVPEAVLRFKQGFGRLIRRRSDRGIVAVLDPRLLGKGY
ncbi:MAG TPA: helicase C-terminal domain-containing protein, partial [Candidatus Eisenbacteria bacterium]|nr:helicase C-terminal domain-containing protein [Candidatus Eisenbacteria bacterium]